MCSIAFVVPVVSVIVTLPVPSLCTMKDPPTGILASAGNDIVTDDPVTGMYLPISS